MQSLTRGQSRKYQFLERRKWRIAQEPLKLGPCRCVGTGFLDFACSGMVEKGCHLETLKGAATGVHRTILLLGLKKNLVEFPVA
jgi:hypothetical protein